MVWDAECRPEGGRGEGLCSQTTTLYKFGGSTTQCSDDGHYSLYVRIAYARFSSSSGNMHVMFILEESSSDNRDYGDILEPSPDFNT